MGAAFTSGLDKVVIPFIDKGIPIEYELVRSICTVAQQERKKLGILKTDVPADWRFLDARADRRIADRHRAEEAIRRGRKSIRRSRSISGTTCCSPCSRRR